MTFTTPLALTALPIVPLLGLLALAWKTASLHRLQRLSRHATAPSRTWSVQLILLLCALTLLIFALAGPRWGRSTEEVTVRSRNVMLAVDVSRSMLARDVHPNRLERAKADLIDLVEVLQGDRAGLLAFRGKGVLLCPMTSDRAYLSQTIDALEPESAPPGETDLADAIAKCLAAFEQAQSAHNAILLISDGEDLAGEAATLAKTAGERHIPIFTVGIGSTQGAPIPDGNALLKYDGQTVRSQLTESTLRAIAEASGGRYIPLATAGTARTTLGAIYTRYLAQLADQEAKEQIETAFTDRTGLFILAAILCLLVAASLSAGRIALASALVLCGSLLYGQEARDAQRAYRQGDFQTAAERYASARLQAEPSEAAHYAYNEALALWKANATTNALERVRLATNDRAFAARANTLEGTLLLQMAADEDDLQARLTLREEALAAFTRALQAEPHASAERNLARAQHELDRLRQDARKAKALAQYKDQGLGQLIPALLQQQRALIQAAPEVFSIQQPTARLAQSEQLGKDVTAQADRWYPVIEQLPQAVEDEALRTTLLTQAKAAQEALDDAAARYEALDDDAQALVAGEPFVYDLWKTIADPPNLNNEAILLQEHAMKGGARYQIARDDQAEVLQLLQQFRLIFPKWAEEQLQQQAQQPPPSAEGEQPPPPSFTQEDVEIINQTADATVPLITDQMDAATQQRVLDNLKKIAEHLPKQNNQQQPQQNPQNQQQQNQQQQQEQQEQQQQAEAEEQQAQESEAEEQQEAQQDELEALLQKAVDREREHEDEKRRARPRLPASTRDW